MRTESPWTPTPVTAPVAALALDGGVAYAALADGRVLRSDDGGETWAVAATTRAGAVGALLPTEDALLVALSGGVVRIRPGAATEPAGGLPDDAGVGSLLRGAGVALAGTVQRGVYRSLDGGATWAEANRGLPFEGEGLRVSGLAAADGGLFAAHPLGVSRSRDGGRTWEPAGYGLPLQIGRVGVVASGRRLLAAVDRRLFLLTGAEWAEVGVAAADVVGADAAAVYALDPKWGLVRAAAGGGRWWPYGHGLPALPRTLALGEGWQFAAPGADGVWRRPAGAPPQPEMGPRLVEVPAVLAEAPAEVAFWLPTTASVVLALVSGAGDEVLRLTDGVLGPGPHRVPLVAADLTAGLYRCRLVVGDQAVSRPIAVVPALSAAR